MAWPVSVQLAAWVGTVQSPMELPPGQVKTEFAPTPSQVGGTDTDSEKAPVAAACGLSESTTLREKLEVPVVFAVPEIVPAGQRQALRQGASRQGPGVRRQIGR